MKTSLALVFLAALSVKAEINWEHLKPLDIVKPVNPKYTAQEWQEIYAAQKPSPEYYPDFKKGTEPQPEFAGKVHVHLGEQEHRITGGSIANRSQFPWQAAFVVDDAYFCGGSLISTQWVLTAAHCAGSVYQIVLGANRIDVVEEGAEVHLAVNSVIHSQYDADTINNDIAVIQLPYPISFSPYVSPPKLPPSNLGTLAGERVIASGWGKPSDSASGVSTTLRYVELTVITNQQCANTYGNAITSSKICTSTTGGKSTCSGDSGGPLVFLVNGVYNLVGIVSFGASEGCERGYPAAFTRVTSYLSWIQSNTGVTLQL